MDQETKELLKQMNEAYTARLKALEGRIVAIDLLVTALIECSPEKACIARKVAESLDSEFSGSGVDLTYARRRLALLQNDDSPGEENLPNSRTDA